MFRLRAGLRIKNDTEVINHSLCRLSRAAPRVPCEGWVYGGSTRPLVRDPAKTTTSLVFLQHAFLSGLFRGYGHEQGHNAGVFTGTVHLIDQWHFFPHGESLKAGFVGEDVTADWVTFGAEDVYEDDVSFSWGTGFFEPFGN
ncbi:MAG TPA: hypothetical protein PLM14_14325, partial [Candidatus Hydrogenedentes bacterium]|nr:hypothetical protein [Candidatus Hydrogenedentota bacterium]